MAIVLFLGLLGYILLRWWYKKNYETHLFKDKKDIYNLMNFIKNARSRGMADGDVTKKLKKNGWEGGQIRYAFKKLKGERKVLVF